MNKKVDCSLVMIPWVINFFNLLGSHAHFFQDYVCLELRLLTIFELKLVEVLMMVDSHDWVVNTWHCWENVFLGVGRW